MNFKNLLKKSLLVAVGLCAGVTSALGALTPFSESYTSTSTVTGWSTSVSGRFTPVILSESENYYLSVAQDSRDNNGAVVTGNILSGKAAAGDDFTLTFDMRLANTNEQQSVVLEIKDAANSATMFSLTSADKNSTEWFVNATSTKVNLPNSGPGTKYDGTDITSITWCSYKITRSGSFTYVTITNKSTGVDILSRTIISGASATGGLGNIIFTTKRKGANLGFDNIVLRAVESDDVPSAAPTTCTVKFQNALGTTLKADATINTLEGATVNADDYIGAFTEAGQKYIYVSGNTSITADADPSANVITLVFREAATWNYAIYAVDGDETQIAVVASGTAFEGDTKTAYFPKVFKKDGIWYKTNSGSNGSTYYSFILTESTKTKNVTYLEADNIDYFFECEDLTIVNKRDDGSSAERGSNGAGVRLSNEGYIYTTALSGGNYTMRLNWNNPNSGTPSFNIKMWDGEKLIETCNTIKKSTASDANFAEETTTEIAIVEGMCLAICNNTGYNGNPTLDYIILERTGDATVSKPITSAGWATYCSPYALDLEHATGLTDAYIVTGGTDGVQAKTSVKSGTVPANTGLLLKGDEGTATIPVVASSSTDVDANILVGKTAAEVITAGTGWVLMGTPKLGFYKNTNAFTVGANTAYIPVASLPVPAGAGTAPAFFSLFDGETTGINTVKASEFTVDGEYYNLAGQRVAQPTKGLYIVNGKKVIVK